MIHYTPLSEMEIFPDENQNDTFNNRSCVSYKGKLMHVEKTNDGSYELLQLLSTDPQDFMDEAFTPGSNL